MKKNMINKNYNGWATLEICMLLPVIVLLISILILVGEIYKNSMTIQFDAYNLSKYISDKSYIDNKLVTSSNCKEFANDYISKRNFYVLDCTVKDNILSIELKRGLRLPLNPLPLFADKELKAQSFIYVR